MTERFLSEVEVFVCSALLQGLFLPIADDTSSQRFLKYGYLSLMAEKKRKKRKAKEPSKLSR